MCHKFPNFVKITARKGQNRGILVKIGEIAVFGRKRQKSWHLVRRAKGSTLNVQYQIGVVCLVTVAMLTMATVTIVGIHMFNSK